MYNFEQFQLAEGKPSLLQNRLNLSAKTLRLLFAKINITESGCWAWTGARVKGYGVIHIRSLRASFVQVHRLCYELVHGRLPGSVILHHQVEAGCMGRICCHPDHLQKTDRAEHTTELSPNSISFINAHKTGCPAGHPFTIESLHVTRTGVRHCRICDAIRHQAARDRNHPDRPKFKRDPATFKTHCLRGHALEGETVYLVNTKWGPQRRCRECDKIRQAAYYARKRKNE